MGTTDLIHSICGIETPSPGRWLIAPGQPLTLTVGRRDRGHAAASVAGGALVVGRAELDVALELALVAPGLPTGPALVLAARLRRAELSGRWWFEGTLRWAGPAGEAVEAPVSAVVHYRGVYRRGDHAIAWLDLQARLPLVPASPAMAGRPRPAPWRARRNGWAAVEGHLNADAPLDGGRPCPAVDVDVSAPDVRPAASAGSARSSS